MVSLLRTGLKPSPSAPRFAATGLTPEEALMPPIRVLSVAFRRIERSRGSEIALCIVT